MTDEFSHSWNQSMDATKKETHAPKDDLPKCQSCNCSAPHIQLYRKRQSKVVLTPTDAISKPCL